MAGLIGITVTVTLVSAAVSFMTTAGYYDITWPLLILLMTAGCIGMLLCRWAFGCH